MILAGVRSSLRHQATGCRASPRDPTLSTESTAAPGTPMVILLARPHLLDREAFERSYPRKTEMLHARGPRASVLTNSWKIRGCGLWPLNPRRRLSAHRLNNQTCSPAESRVNPWAESSPSTFTLRPAWSFRWTVNPKSTSLTLDISPQMSRGANSISSGTSVHQPGAESGLLQLHAAL